jgi:hypothetical protein
MVDSLILIFYCRKTLETNVRTSCKRNKKRTIIINISSIWYNVCRTKRSKSSETVCLVIGLTNHKERKRISTVISSNIEGYKRSKNIKPFSVKSLEEILGLYTTVLITGNLLSEILDFYNQFGSSPKINISKLNLISYGDIIEKESIRLKDVTQ